ncbi:hypothetical protein PMG11_03073 [Penicillium brasilianum]|uniref:Uncharacterized protein n=1 Tax=Penicillium brasilianum TaxID=104259 RepID=A0A0F7VGI9_PENBI|nr:hypothetical protein PMG11_03073 [Penicillium brasilianum]
MATFKPLVPPHIIPHNATNPNAATPIPGTRPSLSPAFRDNLTLSSWLLVGGLLQGLSLLTLGPITLLPTALILLYRAIDTLLITFKLTRNRYLDGVVHTKWSPQIPYPDGTFGHEPSRDQIVVFHLGARSNHPLGLFAPGMKALGEHFEAMIDEMCADPQKSGLLGTSRWIKQDDAAGNDTMTVFYLRDFESLHRFAYGEVHMDGVRYWNRIVRDSPHIAIYHETYVVPRGHWEAIYINSKPTGLGDMWFPFKEKGEEKEEEEEEGKGETRGFIRPIVDARTGILRSKNGRMSTAKMEEVREYDRNYGDAYSG